MSVKEAPEPPVTLRLLQDKLGFVDGTLPTHCNSPSVQPPYPPPLLTWTTMWHWVCAVKWGSLCWATRRDSHSAFRCLAIPSLFFCPSHPSQQRTGLINTITKERTQTFPHLKPTYIQSCLHFHDLDGKKKHLTKSLVHISTNNWIFFLTKIPTCWCNFSLSHP